MTYYSYHTNSGIIGLLRNEEVIQYIKYLIRESNNPQNEEWVQQGFKEKIRALRDEINSVTHPKDK